MAKRTQVVRNEGSTARDHLANERTLLAWMRTGLGVIGLGAVVGKLVIDRGHIAGLVLIAFGAVMLIYGVARYVKVMARLRVGEFPIASFGPVVVSILALLATSVAALLVAW